MNKKKAALTVDAVVEINEGDIFNVIIIVMELLQSGDSK